MEGRATTSFKYCVHRRTRETPRKFQHACMHLGDAWVCALARDAQPFHLSAFRVSTHGCFTRSICRLQAPTRWVSCRRRSTRRRRRNWPASPNRAGAFGPRSPSGTRSPAGSFRWIGTAGRGRHRKSSRSHPAWWGPGGFVRSDTGCTRSHRCRRYDCSSSPVRTGCSIPTRWWLCWFGGRSGLVCTGAVCSGERTVGW
jgi:hypothetical protein